MTCNALSIWPLCLTVWTTWQMPCSTSGTVTTLATQRWYAAVLCLHMTALSDKLLQAAVILQSCSDINFKHWMVAILCYVVAPSSKLTFLLSYYLAAACTPVWACMDRQSKAAYSKYIQECSRLCVEKRIQVPQMMKPSEGFAHPLTHDITQESACLCPQGNCSIQQRSKLLISNQPEKDLVQATHTPREPSLYATHQQPVAV